jgi:hypothetical protein
MNDDGYGLRFNSLLFIVFAASSWRRCTWCTAAHGMDGHDTLEGYPVQEALR